MIRCGFTLIEIMVSIMIFTVVALAMMTIMLMASEIYRQGEAGRAANDETVSVMAALDDDLGRILPAADGGWFYASTDSDGDGSFNGSGDTLIAFLVSRRDRSQITSGGAGTRAMVAWWLEGNALRRAEVAMPAKASGDDPTIDYALLDVLIPQILATRSTWPVITTGCLHFGGIVSSAMQPTQSDPEYCTGPSFGDAHPDALRITVVLTGGGRFASTGFLVDAITTTGSSSPATFRIAGVKMVPSSAGAMVRIDDEWIGYRYAAGKLDYSGASDPLVGRGLRNSVKAVHLAGAKVFFGHTHTLVRRLPN